VGFNNFQALQEKVSKEILEELLEEVGGLLEVSIRDVDILASVESDLFGLILPETDVEDAEIVIRRIRENLELFQFSQPLPEQPSFSIGVSS
jgi:diguanylate cyclase